MSAGPANNPSSALREQAPHPAPAAQTDSKTRGRAVRWERLSEAQKRVLATPAGFARGYLGIPLYPAQEAVLNDLAPLGARVSMRTCNESGKTQCVIAPFILWHASVFPRGLAVSTSGSWSQVTRQLAPRLRSFAAKFPAWTFNAETITSSSGPRWIGFSTNNPGRAEGYHGSAEAPLAALVDEAKTVSDEIIDMLEARCNPQRLGLFSSPGHAQGAFYRSQTLQGALWKRHRVTAAQCPHISPESIARRRALYPEGHLLVRSALDAEFMEVVEGALLSLACLDHCRSYPPAPSGDERHAFLDFAAGGDENVLAMRQGNQAWLADCWRDTDTRRALNRFVLGLNRLKAQTGLRPEEAEGDADGLGKPMIDSLREEGWPVLAFHGASPPLWESHCLNRASEVWDQRLGADQTRANHPARRSEPGGPADQPARRVRRPRPPADGKQGRAAQARGLLARPGRRAPGRDGAAALGRVGEPPEPGAGV